MPIFRVKSVKVYTGQKKFTRAPPVAPVTNMRYDLRDRKNAQRYTRCADFELQTASPTDFQLCEKKTFVWLSLSQSIFEKDLLFWITRAIQILQATVKYACGSQILQAMKLLEILVILPTYLFPHSEKYFMSCLDVRFVLSKMAEVCPTTTNNGWTIKIGQWRLERGALFLSRRKPFIK